MRHLIQPRVLNTASILAAVSALACYPRMTLWLHRPGPIWYLEATIFICCIMLWASVLAWHVPYARRPVFIVHLDSNAVIVATLTATVAAIAFHLWLDPFLRPDVPEEYPADVEHWLASVPFILAFNQLLLVFAPFDWLMRLCKNRWVATSVAALLGVGVMLLKVHTQAISISPLLLTVVLLGRIAATFLLIAFYLRGGVFLVWWWTFLFECRHLFNLIGGT